MAVLNAVVLHLLLYASSGVVLPKLKDDTTCLIEEALCLPREFLGQGLLLCPTRWYSMRISLQKGMVQYMQGDVLLTSKIVNAERNA